MYAECTTQVLSTTLVCVIIINKLYKVHAVVAMYVRVRGLR